MLACWQDLVYRWPLLNGRMAAGSPPSRCPQSSRLSSSVWDAWHRRGVGPRVLVKATEMSDWDAVGGELPLIVQLHVGRQFTPSFEQQKPDTPNDTDKHDTVQGLVWVRTAGLQFPPQFSRRRTPLLASGRVWGPALEPPPFQSLQFPHALVARRTCGTPPNYTASVATSWQRATPTNHEQQR
jgi:hypothetical protein